MVEPPEDKRVTLRCRDTGVQGYLVFDEVSGDDYVRVSRGGGHTYDKKYVADAWAEEEAWSTLSSYDVAQLRFVADAKLGEIQMDYERSRRTWHSLTPKQRELWRKTHPKADIRQALSKAIESAMEKFLKDADRKKT